MLFLFCMLVLLLCMHVRGTTCPLQDYVCSDSRSARALFNAFSCALSFLLHRTFFLTLHMPFSPQPCLFFVLIVDCLFKPCTWVQRLPAFIRQAIYARLLIARASHSSRVLTCIKNQQRIFCDCCQGTEAQTKSTSVCNGYSKDRHSELSREVATVLQNVYARSSSPLLSHHARR